MKSLPLVSADLPGIGGRIKSAPEHFVVEEIPLYPLSGSGEHLFVRLRRSGMTTREVIEQCARAFGIAPRDVGHAGLKDKHAIATQSFSMWIPRMSEADAALRVRDLPGEVLDVRRHANKLRRGHLIGNRFEITVVGAHDEALVRARAIAGELAQHGVPNFFGEQRFGDRERNVEAGRAVLARPRGGFVARLQLSAWQSALFNDWLVHRFERGDFERIFAGDVGKRLADGALFDVVDEPAENERLARGETSYTGPIFGSKMRRARGEPGRVEDEELALSGVTVDDLKRARLDGTRRAARIFLGDLDIRASDAGLVFAFQLPKGAYATNALREFMKTEIAAEEAELASEEQD